MKTKQTSGLRRVVATVRVVLALVTASAAPAFASFVPNGDGTAADSDTGLVWDRCAWGSTWNAASTSCASTGAETFTWAGALSAATAANAANHLGHNDWRLPSKNELESLVDISATASPVIDPVFPWPYAGADFWSSTTSTAAPSGAWRVDFASGSVGVEEKTVALRVRLLRGGFAAAGFDGLGGGSNPGPGNTLHAITSTANPAAAGVVSCSPNPVVQGGSATCTASAAPGYALTHWSGDCSGTVCVLGSVVAARSVTAHFAVIDATFGPIPTRKSGVSASLVVSGCTSVAAASFVNAPTAAAAPAQVRFPYGVLDLTLHGCNSGTASVTVNYSEPLPSGNFYKEISGSYVPYPATVSGSSTTFSLVDNGLGDSDPAIGTIHDPAGLAVAAAGAASIPTLSDGGLAFLATVLAGVALLSGRRARRSTR